MEYWATRDKDGFLALWDGNEPPPKRQENSDSFIAIDGTSKWCMISSILLPEVTWENSPKKVEVKITE